MDNKKAKYIDAIFNYFEKDLSRDNDAVQKLFEELCVIEINEAFNMWEYMLVRREKKLTEAKSIEMLIDRPLVFFNEKSNRTPKMVLDTPIFLKAVYFYSPEPVAAIPLDIAVYGLMAGKYSQAEEIFKHLQKNTVTKNTYGENMKIIVEKLFLEILKKKGGASKKAELPKKLYDLLNRYVKKISGPEKALLEQRIKEVM